KALTRAANSPRHAPSCIASLEDSTRDSHLPIPRFSASAFRGGIPSEEMSEGSSIAEKPTEKEELQNWQTRSPAGNTAPHCEHIFVTVSFALRTLPLRCGESVRRIARPRKNQA